MRPRAILGVPGLDPAGSAFSRFQDFARMIVKVPKAEADKKIGERQLSPNKTKKKAE